MPVEFIYQCTLTSGLHARPCSHVAEIAGRFPAATTLTNRRNGRIADAKSVLSLISADVLAGDECTFMIHGPEETSAAAALRSFLENELATHEEAPIATSGTKPALPRSLRLAQTQAAFGTPLISGWGQGKLLIAEGIQLPALKSCENSGDSQLERQKLHQAMRGLRQSFADAAANISGAALGIVNAHRAILDDPTFAGRIYGYIDQGDSAGDAIIRASLFFTHTLAGSESAYIRERAIDIQEVSLRLYEVIYGHAGGGITLHLNSPTILIAMNLGAQELLHLDRTHLRGIVFGEGQATSHAVILARSLGIPAIAGATEVTHLFTKGEEVILDGGRGYVVAISPATQRFYDREQALESLRSKTLSQYANAIGVTADHRPVEVAANVSSPEEAKAAFQRGCDGIGLFRTEMLFVGREAPPTEEEQFAAYAHAAQAGRGKPVILRTFDVGGDKPVAFLHPSRAIDSSLGNRGILIYKEYGEVLQAQLRAMLRASALGNVRIMVPLISTVDEIRWMREQITRARQTLQARQQSFDQSVQVGIMIELPAAVPRLGELAAYADFFSIGTNDLAQYFFAEDRTRAKTNLRASIREPAFLRLLRDIAIRAKESGKWLGMCGEMAGDPHNLPLLVGLGLDEISMGGDVLPMKKRLNQLSTSKCAELFEQAIACTSIKEVDALLASFPCTPLPLVDPQLVNAASTSDSREEVIRELVDVLYLNERTTDPDRLEDALWERESTYPTDMGLGFALPHCKSDVVQHSSISISRPAKRFLWSPESTVPVRAVIMLAMRNDAAAHMQVLSKLARKLMDEEFRECLFAFPDPQAAVECLTQQAGITTEMQS